MLNLLISILLVLFAQVSAYEGCDLINETNGTIYYEGNEFKCWKIFVPSNKYLELEFTSMELLGDGCQDSMIKIMSFEEETIICPPNNPLVKIKKFNTTFVNITIYQQQHYVWFQKRRFLLNYQVSDILCLNRDSFKCTAFSCIFSELRCDGTQDCSNGIDEIGCKTHLLEVIENITSIHSNQQLAQKWLKEQRNVPWRLKDNTHRSVVALSLAQGDNFNGTNKDEELIAKQLELRLSTAILRNSTDIITPTQLSLYVHALLVLCHDPRNFYGYNLIEDLKNQARNSETFHPLPYLALCNAQELPSMNKITILHNIANSSSNHSYRTDIQAMALMTLSCISSNNDYPELEEKMMNVAENLKKQQLTDGSFGNIYTTALVVQALLSLDKEDFKGWNLKTAIEFLMRKQNKIDGSFGDIFATYLILPILSGKTLVDIGRINCTKNKILAIDGTSVSHIEMKLGKKILVHYTVYLGDQKTEEHPISLRTPENITILEVMKLAATADPKYKFKYQKLMGKIYIYEILGVVNDAEDGQFWLLYTGRNNSSLEIVNTCPDETVVHDKEEIVLWYKSAGIL